MLRLIAIPLLAIAGLPNRLPNPEKLAEPTIQRIVEEEPDQCCNTSNSIFHSGVVAGFGLNKTALRPMGDKRFKTANPRNNAAENSPKQAATSLKAIKPVQDNESLSPELVTPITINLYF
jgi:hypothetical protein